jgi:putative peptidoglycan lipid II flippase
MEYATVRTVSLAFTPVLGIERRPVLANAAIVGTLTAAARLAAAVKIAVTARFFGAGDELDAYLTAFLIPAMFGDPVAGAFTPSLLPGLIRAERDAGADAARRLARSASGLALGIMGALAMVFALSARWTLPVLGLSFSPGKLRLAEMLFYGLLLWLPLGALIASWRAVLNAHGRFALAAGAPLATPALAIAALYIGVARWGIFVLVAATVMGVVTECLLLAIAVSRLGYPILPRWPAASDRTPELRNVSRQFLPLMTTAVLSSSSLPIDQAFAGSLEAGSVSALSFGTKLPGVVMVVIGAAIATAALPEFSRFAARGQWGSLRAAAVKYGGILTLLAVPLAAALIAFSEPLARLFYERGAFSPADTKLVASVQRLALLEVPAAVLFAIVSRVATAIGANRLLAQLGLAMLAVNAAGDWLLSRWWGVAGIALSTALVRVAAVILLVMLLCRREPRLLSGDARA